MTGVLFEYGMKVNNNLVLWVGGVVVGSASTTRNKRSCLFENDVRKRRRMIG